MPASTYAMYIYRRRNTNGLRGHRAKTNLVSTQTIIVTRQRYQKMQGLEILRGECALCAAVVPPPLTWYI